MLWTILKIQRWPILACFIVVIALTLWPGDVAWGGDDVVLITSAIKANHEHHLIDAGLGGSFGYPYGPLPEQIYQLLVTISNDPVTIVRLHAALAGGVTAFGLLYLSAALGLSPWLAPMVLVGPFFWFYTRLLWDNTFAIPVGCLLLGSYADYLRRKSAAAFLTAAACAVALPLIHPMTLPLVIAVSCHAIWFHRAGFRKNWIGLLVIFLCAALCSGKYVQRVAEQIGHSAALIPPRADALSRPAALSFPLFSGRLLSAHGFFDERGPESGWETTIVGHLAISISAIAFPLVWVGIFVGITRFIRGCRRTASPIDAIASISIVALLFQSLMDFLLRISPYPHYYCGTWAAAVLLLWLGIDALRNQTLRIAVGAVYGLSMAVTTLAFAVDIHTHSGGRVWYGPSLDSQLQVARKLRPFTHAAIQFKVARVRENPTGVLSLIKLLPTTATAHRVEDHVTVDYDPGDSQSCRLMIIGAVDR